jgi:hypothetical protein
MSRHLVRKSSTDEMGVSQYQSGETSPKADFGIADTGFIFFVLVPGYTRVWPSVLGPVFWVLAMIFSTVALLTRTKGATTELYGRQHRT